MMKIIRVFPRRTKATPTDDLAFVGQPPLTLPEVDEAHISVAFTWDKPLAEQLAASWAQYYPVRIGGPAYDDTGGEFEPGRYLAEGYTITSRGCPNKCGFCMAWRREGSLRTMPIRPGHIVLDNNLLACSRPHIESVLDMLGQQKKRAEFAGGLEADRVEPWFVKRAVEIRFKRAYLAYDRPAERLAVADALRLFHEAGVRHDQLSCFVLVGYEGDSVEDASKRCQFVKDCGGVPFPMYFRPEGKRKRIESQEWVDFVGRILNCPGGKAKEQRAGQMALFAMKPGPIDP